MFNLPNFFTAFNLLSGALSIIFVFAGRIELSVAFIFLGAFFDFFDGFLARILKQQSELGKQLDSLADMITFGVAPGMITFSLIVVASAWNNSLLNGLTLDQFWMDGTFGANIQHWMTLYLSELSGNYPNDEVQFFSRSQLLLPFIALLIPFFSLFRLAKFNLDERQTDKFIGLPTPANAIFFSSFALVLWSGFDSDSWKASLSMALIQPTVLIPLVIIFSLLLVSEFNLIALKFKNMKWKDNQMRFILIIASVVSITIAGFWALSIIILIYLLLSFIDNFFFNQ